MAESPSPEPFTPTFGGFFDSVADIANFAYGIYNNERNHAYQEELNNLQMTREDSAYQRAVEDAQKAGLSKAVVGSGSSSSALSTNNGSANLRTEFMQRAMNRASMQQMNTQNELLQAQTAKALAEVDKVYNDITFQNATLTMNESLNQARINDINQGIALNSIKQGLLANDLFFSNKNKEYYGTQEYLDKMYKLANESYKTALHETQWNNHMATFKLNNPTLFKITDLVKNAGSAVSSFAPFMLMTKGLGGLFSGQSSSF
ncbi:hypothetical protein [Jeotgalibaca porci]|uniref:hypothetical protein n=1 Tax=Jeotgalibaca porci TaxID=1868793 RepID=UPI00359F42BE